MKIKGMDKDMKCRGFQFEIGKEYKIEHDGKPLELCSDTVFHYCDSLRKVHEHYSCNDKELNRFFEIEVLGEEVTDGQKCGSDHIKIVREIVGEELKAMKGMVNGNTGVFNTGDCNTGHGNTGDKNTGDKNTGDKNTGDRNTGYGNTGDKNTGDWNTGDRNTGYGNTIDGSNGVFCTEPDMNIRIFNRPSGMSLQDFYRSKYYVALCSAPFVLTEWILYTEKEKKADPEKEMIGGYLKEYTMQEAWTNWWEKMSEENKKIVQEIPNFDAEVFKEITGIEV
nr:MAG TPA: pentapeptide repeat protein [Caudoviricetes sp.]